MEVYSDLIVHHVHRDRAPTFGPDETIGRVAEHAPGHSDHAAHLRVDPETGSSGALDAAEDALDESGVIGQEGGIGREAIGVHVRQVATGSGQDGEDSQRTFMVLVEGPDLGNPLGSFLEDAAGRGNPGRVPDLVSPIHLLIPRDQGAIPTIGSVMWGIGRGRSTEFHWFRATLRAKEDAHFDGQGRDS